MPAQAIIVQQRRRGPRQMVGMGDAGSVLTDIADAATGGLVSTTEAKLDELSITLKISIGLSIASSLLSIWAISQRGR